MMGRPKCTRTSITFARTNRSYRGFEQQQIEQVYQAAQKEMHSLKADEQILRNSIEEGKKQILSILEDNGGTMPEEELIKKNRRNCRLKR